MGHDIWVSFFSYTIITALSPGPNNILALNVTGNHSMKQSRSLLWGIYLGFFTIQVLCGIFSSFLVELMPNILLYMKCVGGTYILWLAYHVALSKPVNEIKNTKGLSFWKGFFLQFANVKIILWGISAFNSYILPYYSSTMEIIAFIFLLTLIGDGATFVWAVAGSVFDSVLKKYWLIINIVMALVLVYSATCLILGK